MIMIDPPFHDPLPSYSLDIKCPDHPEAIPEQGYGFAGGMGLGVYSSCPECDCILSKTLDPEETEEDDPT